MIKVTKLERQFLYEGKELADPDPNMPVESVLKVYSHEKPELLNATITGPEEKGGKAVFTFAKNIGRKG